MARTAIATTAPTRAGPGAAQGEAGAQRLRSEQRAADQPGQDRVEIAVCQRIGKGKDLGDRQEGHHRPDPPGRLLAPCAQRDEGAGGDGRDQRQAREPAEIERGEGGAGLVKRREAPRGDRHLQVASDQCHRRAQAHPRVRIDRLHVGDGSSDGEHLGDRECGEDRRPDPQPDQGAPVLLPAASCAAQPGEHRGHRKGQGSGRLRQQPQAEGGGGKRRPALEGQQRQQRQYQAELVLSWEIQATASTLAGWTRKNAPPSRAAASVTPERLSSSTSSAEARAWSRTFTR